jgi:hypothetical protein
MRIKNIKRVLWEQPDFKPILLIFMLSLGQTIWWGYGFAIGDHAVQIPFIKHILNPNLYPNDPMVATSSGYTTFFTYFIAILIKLFRNMEIIYFTVHLASMFLFMLVVYKLSLLLFDNQIVAIVSLAFMFFKKLTLGKSGIHYTSMDHTFILYPFALLGVWFFLRERKAIGFAIVGLVFNFQALTATYAFSMLAFSALLEAAVNSWRYYRNRDSSIDIREMWLKQTLFPIGMFVAFALPTIIWSISNSGGAITDEWIKIFRARSSHHSFPFSWSKEHYVNYLLFLAFGAVALSQAPARRFHGKIMAFVLAIGILCGIGVIFAEYYPVKLVLRMQLFRSTTYLTIFCLLYISNYIVSSWGKSGIHRIAAILNVLILVILSYYNLAVLVLILYVLAEWVLPGRGERTPHFGILLFIIFAIVLRIYSPHNSFPGELSLSPLSGLLRKVFEDRLLVILSCLAIILAWKDRVSIGIIRKLATGIVVLTLAFYVIPSAFSRFHPAQRYESGWIDVQLWAKENTPIHATFLTPPYSQGFRIFSERPIVVDWKDGTQQYFDTEYGYEWWERVQMVGGNSRKYDEMSEEEYIAIARKYKASYIVVPASRTLNLEKAYVNKEYAVYRITGTRVPKTEEIR